MIKKKKEKIAILKDLLRKEPWTKRDLAIELNCEERTIGRLLHAIDRQGVPLQARVDVSKDNTRRYFIQTGLLPTQRYQEHIDSNRFMVGMIGDTHLCCFSERLDALNDFYENCKKEGIKIVYHAGDLLDGFNVYPGHINFIHTFGTDNQVAYAIRNYPKVDGIETKFITGNHELRVFKDSGVDMGNLIVRGVRVGDEEIEGREDMKYLGQYAATISLPEGVKLELLHPAKGTAYAKSYHPQRHVDNLPLEERPDILLWGHQHDMNYTYHGGVHLLKAGCFQDMNAYSKTKGFPNIIGGWMVEIDIENGRVKSLNPRWTGYPSKGYKG